MTDDRQEAHAILDRLDADGVKEAVETLRDIEEFFEARRNYQPEPEVPPKKITLKLGQTYEMSQIVWGDDDE